MSAVSTASAAIVRPAAEQDVDRLLVMAVDMHAESPRYRRRSFDAERTRAFLLGLLSAGAVFVAETDTGELVGAVGGFVMPYFFSLETFAAEVFVYVAPSHRRLSVGAQLVVALERWSFERGAQELELGVSTGVAVEKTVGLYEQLGFRRWGMSVLKDRPVSRIQ